MMRRAFLAALTVAALPLPAAAQQQLASPGRYSVTAVPSAERQSPTVILLDTATGQTWILSLAEGQVVEWLPVRYWLPPGQVATDLLPPRPERVGIVPRGAAR